MPSITSTNYLTFRVNERHIWTALNPITFEDITVQKINEYGWVIAVDGIPLNQGEPHKRQEEAFAYCESLLPRDIPLWRKHGDYTLIGQTIHHMEHKTRNSKWIVTKHWHHKTSDSPSVMNAWQIKAGNPEGPRVFAYEDLAAAMYVAELLAYHTSPGNPTLPPEFHTFPYSPDTAQRILCLPHPTKPPYTGHTERSAA